MTDTALAGLNIVVTRPREQAVELAQRIEQHGGKVLLLPLLEIAPSPDQRPLRELAQHFTAYDLLVFISPNAVNHAMAVLGRVPDSIRVATVGQSSAQMLRQRGMTKIISPSGRSDSEALLALPELQEISGWRVAILRGDGGRELLGDTLKQRGAKVEYITCYLRSKPDLDINALAASKPDALTVTSSEALQHLSGQLGMPDGAWLASIPLFVPHHRIAALAGKLGWQKTMLTLAGDDGLLSALVAWAKQSHTESQP